VVSVLDLGAEGPGSNRGFENRCLVNRGTMGVNSLPKTVTRQRRDCDLNPGPSAPESSTLTTRLPSHPLRIYSSHNFYHYVAYVYEAGNHSSRR